MLSMESLKKQFLQKNSFLQKHEQNFFNLFHLKTSLDIHDSSLDLRMLRIITYYFQVSTIERHDFYHKQSISIILTLYNSKRSKVSFLYLQLKQENLFPTHPLDLQTMMAQAMKLVMQQQPQTVSTIHYSVHYFVKYCI